jgi:transcriptional regulator of aroF, aroG, tyrA and aromatic amino acid transport
MRLEITCQDRLGITQDVLELLTAHQIDLRGIEIAEEGKIYLSFPHIEFADFQQFMPKIRRIPGVEDVKTTLFMPIERERNELRAIIQTMPDPVFSIDTKGRIVLFNDAAKFTVDNDISLLHHADINELVKGFNFAKWLDKSDNLAQTVKVKYVEQDYIADLLPVFVPDSDKHILAGAVIILKSELRLGQQFNVFHRTETNSFDKFHAHSPAMRKVIKEAKRMADLDGPMIIFGETGTGKELIARACHDASKRVDGPFLALNCAALPDDVAETELFGFGKGTFGSTESKTGLLKDAEGGTLLLDEIADMSEQLQGKLLRVLEEGEFRRVGDKEPVKVDVRIICTTCKDLGQQVESGKFRQDLYYRLNVLGIVMPALRERKQDIIPLTEAFIKQHCAKLGRNVAKLSKSCVDYLNTYPWPGNVRQLQNALYRALTLLDGNEITKGHIHLPSCSTTVSYIDENFDGTLDEEVKKFEKDLLRKLYPSYPSTRQLAKKLGLSHTAIANKLREYGINKATVKI